MITETIGNMAFKIHIHAGGESGNPDGVNVAVCMGACDADRNSEVMSATAYLRPAAARMLAEELNKWADVAEAIGRGELNR